MFERDNDIYASAPMRRLQNDQKRVLAPVLQRCSGTHALLLTTCAGDMPPAAPMLGCWATLCFDKGRYRGDLDAAADEPMPFVDDAFQLIVMRHVLEVVTSPAALLDEAVRTLAPGGVLAITGVHPISVWSPWFCWRGRPGVRRLLFPFGLNSALLRGGLEVERIDRVGQIWPGLSRGMLPANLLGGGYVLIARKRPHT
ncbi:MAG: class I SAM-dependent methyltransferase, partial [Pseudomonadota bacterium]|nr:class I SAM-dependent methyltransferase [Pseudomonadota bacterium]